MIEQHRSDRAVVVGSSTHNERIERLWRDVFRCVGTVFYAIFKQLEEEEKLDPLNEIDIILYCLHRVFLPRINATLDAFVESALLLPAFLDILACTSSKPHLSIV